MLTRKMLRLCSSLFLALVLWQQPALAGPPLICHPLEIGNAQSLPWAGPNWRDVKKDYDLSRLVTDTLALLQPDTPVLVRMETLRRATIYAVWAKSDREVGTPPPNPQIADELHAKLMDRLRETIRQNKPAAMALFDAGYLDACFKQAGYQAANKAGNGVEAYAMVRKGGQFAANPEIEFALALITIHPRQASHQEHLQKALAGAKDDSLLARNLVKHFGKPGQNLATLRAQTASAKY